MERERGKGDRETDRERAIGRRTETRREEADERDDAAGTGDARGEGVVV
jgi:hypothetical protein